MANPPEGWYPDPIVPGQERWWTGERWSFEYTRPEPATPTPDDAGPAVAARARAITPGWYRIEGDPDTERFYDGAQWTAEVRPTPAAPASGDPHRVTTDVESSSDVEPGPDAPVRIKSTAALGIVVALVVLLGLRRAVVRARARRRRRARAEALPPGVSP